MSSAARAFEQRSAAAVAQVVAELDGAGPAAAVVDATPSSPSPSSPSVVAAGGLDFRAAQIEKDAKLAEELQREEYRLEEARTARQRQRRATATAEHEASWSDWLMGTTTGPSSPGGAAARPGSPAAAAAAGGARVAQPSGSVFACVAQSITSVMGPPQGTQVRGVDSSSLL